MAVSKVDTFKRKASFIRLYKNIHKSGIAVNTITCLMCVELIVFRNIALISSSFYMRMVGYNIIFVVRLIRSQSKVMASWNIFIAFDIDCFHCLVCHIYVLTIFLCIF